MSKGFTLIETLIVVAIIAVLFGMAVPIMQRGVTRANINALAVDAKAIHTAFRKHFIDNSAYPNSTVAPAFELDTFEPLVGSEYYDGRALVKLLNTQADAYDSPDDQGINQEYWLELTLAYDPAIRFLVCDSDDAPLGGGDYLDGIYLYMDGVLQEVGQVGG